LFSNIHLDQIIYFKIDIITKMTNDYNGYDPCEIVKNHFQKMIYILNVHVDKLITQNRDNPRITQKMNEERQEIINKIEKNLQTQLKKTRKLQAVENYIEQFEQKFEHIINDKTMSYEKKLPHLKKYLIDVGAIFLPDANFEIGIEIIFTKGFIDVNNIWT
jgi:DNA anti-recombination protein RmuC